MIDSRKLEDLDPETREMARKFIEGCSAIGIKVLITSTFRDKAMQNALYAKGRTAPGSKVTNARGGSSMHQYRCAFDFVPYADNGKDLDWSNSKKFTRCAEVGEALGLEWGGRWKSFVDMPHLQNARGMTTSQWSAKYPAGERPAQ